MLLTICAGAEKTAGLLGWDGGGPIEEGTADVVLASPGGDVIC